MQKPEVLQTKEIYRGRIFQVSLATVRENETEYTREIIAHPGSAVIVPLFADDTIAFVRQYRHPAGEFLLELPAGSLAPGENPETGARRELEEEIGVRAGRIEKLTEFFVSPGFLGEVMHVFLATDLEATAQNLESDEFLTIERIALDKALKMVANNQIKDAKTMLGVILTGARRGLQIN